jgi:hypothetical protein
MSPSGSVPVWDAVPANGIGQQIFAEEIFAEARFTPFFLNSSLTEIYRQFEMY